MLEKAHRNGRRSSIFDDFRPILDLQVALLAIHADDTAGHTDHVLRHGARVVLRDRSVRDAGHQQEALTIDDLEI